MMMPKRNAYYSWLTSQSTSGWSKNRLAMSQSMADLVTAQAEKESSIREIKDIDIQEFEAPFLCEPVPSADNFVIETAEPSLRSKPWIGRGSQDDEEDNGAERSGEDVAPARKISQGVGYIEVMGRSDRVRKAGKVKSATGRRQTHHRSMKKLKPSWRMMAKQISRVPVRDRRTAAAIAFGARMFMKGFNSVANQE